MYATNLPRSHIRPTEAKTMFSLRSHPIWLCHLCGVFGLLRGGGFGDNFLSDVRWHLFVV